MKCVSALAVAVATTAAIAQDSPVALKLSESVIRVGERDIRPTRGPIDYADERVVDGRRLAIAKSKVSYTKPGSDEQAWEIESSDSRELKWLGGRAGEAYFTIQPGRIQRTYDKPACVRVLDLEKGAWRESILLERPGVIGVEVVTAVVPVDDRVITLTSVLSNSDREAELVGYCVSCFGADRAKALWQVDFATSKLGAHRSKTYLLSATRPTETFPDVQPLTIVGKEVLVCAGSREPVLCLDTSSGRVTWRIDRPWDYRRGFIGPSVWSHHIARFGDHSMDFVEDDAQLSAPRAQFDSKYVCSIVGGPVAVVAPTQRGWAPAEPDYRVFLAVSRAEVGEWPEYVADCVVYEFSHGRPLSMTCVPSMIVGGSFSVRDNRVVWATQDDGFACFGTSEQSMLGSFGPGGPNLIGKMPWYRQIMAPQVRGWLSTDRATERAAMGRKYAFRLSAGGYELKRGDGCFGFPLSIVDLDTGWESTAEIRIPYQGALKEPTSNYGSTTSTDGTRTFFTRGPAVLAVTWLEVVGDALRVFASAEGSESATVVDFQVADIEKALTTKP